MSSCLPKTEFRICSQQHVDLHKEQVQPPLPTVYPAQTLACTQADSYGVTRQSQVLTATAMLKTPWLPAVDSLDDNANRQPTHESRGYLDRNPTNCTTQSKRCSYYRAWLTNVPAFLAQLVDFHIRFNAIDALFRK